MFRKAACCGDRPSATLSWIGTSVIAPHGVLSGKLVPEERQPLLTMRSFQCSYPFVLRIQRKRNMFCYYLEDVDSFCSIRSCRSGEPLGQFPCETNMRIHEWSKLMFAAPFFQARLVVLDISSNRVFSSLLHPTWCHFYIMCYQLWTTYCLTLPLSC